MATTKIKVVKSDDPKKPMTREQAMAFASNFGLRKGLISAENTTIGDKIPPFVDATTGKDITGQPAGKPNIKIDTFVPPEINELQEDNTGYPYYVHPQTGDVIHVPQDYRALPRFNPNKGKTITDLMAMRK